MSVYEFGIIYERMIWLFVWLDLRFGSSSYQNTPKNYGQPLSASLYAVNKIPG